MKRLMAVIAVAALAGCAGQPQQRPLILTAEEARMFTDEALCFGLVTYGPESASRVREEIARRGVNCQTHAAAVNQMLQQRAAQNAQAAAADETRRAMALQMLQSGAFQVKPNTIDPNLFPALRPQTTCTSQWIGGQLQTVCR